MHLSQSFKTAHLASATVRPMNMSEPKPRDAPQAATVDRPLTVRRARASDQHEIVALVRSEPLNPNGLHWQRFVVACDAQGLVGAAQLRHNGDGSHEPASLVVLPRARGQGVAAQMIELLVHDSRGRVFAVTRRTHLGRFLQTVIDFVLIAFVIFLFLKAYNRMRTPAPAPATPEDVLLLREIRDSLKK